MRPAAATAVLMGCFECASGFTLKSLSLIISYVEGREWRGEENTAVCGVRNFKNRQGKI